MTNRAQLRRILGIDRERGENDLNRVWSVKTYIHVGTNKYPICYVENRYVAFLPGRMVTGETMEQARDGVIEALEGRAKGRFDE
jgi:hypothetical protein